MKTQAKVNWFNDAKGYGFLQLGDKLVFIHYTAIMGEGYKTCREGERVFFTLVDGRHGLQASEAYPEHKLDALEVLNMIKRCNGEIVGE